MEKNEISILIATFAVILMTLGIFLLLFYLLFKQKQKKNKMRIAALNEHLLETQIEIQEQTLRNVSEEIHDNIGQVLSLAKLNLATFPNIIDEESNKKLADTRNLVSKAINDLRDLGRSMHGDKIAEAGLENAIESELKFLQNTGKFETHLRISGTGFTLKSQVQMLLFRIVQEALHNEIKHSKAKNIYADLFYDEQQLTLTLKDDGVGFDVAKLQPGKSGIGLQSMKKRASLIGGEFSIYSSENNGTSIIVKIPRAASENTVAT